MNEGSGSSQSGGRDFAAELDALKMAQATQAAAQAGQAATTAATFAGTWSTIVVGAVALFIGMYLGSALNRK